MLDPKHNLTKVQCTAEIPLTKRVLRHDLQMVCYRPYLSSASMRRRSSRPLASFSGIRTRE